ncbi:hypothetical protein VDGE_04763 [Verticillium dahliae]|uniref:Aldose 1-epimerase n=1 Tax=Verticillium dahliae TaxID=27337 RepID=A0A444S6N2_VERDA|nr:hypothetical protein VDGE_04763 [Verticillium dahliae]
MTAEATMDDLLRCKARSNRDLYPAVRLALAAADPLGASGPGPPPRAPTGSSWEDARYLSLICPFGSDVWAFSFLVCWPAAGRRGLIDSFFSKPFRTTGALVFAAVVVGLGIWHWRDEIVPTLQKSNKSKFKPGKDGRYTISAKGIKAQFIPYGATLTNLYVKDKQGNDVDVVLGYDDVDFYPVDPGHPVYNAIPGRYVNRLKAAQFTIGTKTYHTEKNDSTNTLHSGSNNWSYRFWDVTSLASDSITFSISDSEGESKGFPGRVEASVTYSVADGKWNIKMEATAPEAKTPLMLTQHTYFNLEAYRNPSTDDIWSHTLHMPYAKRFLPIDSFGLPTGAIAAVTPGHIMDFASEPDLPFGRARDTPEFATNAGTEGYNHFWLFDDVPSPETVVLTLASPWNGIKADLRTDQRGVQIYSTGWSDGSAGLKSTQGTDEVKTMGRSSAVAIEPHDLVDGVNNPQWGRADAQITGPGETYTWEASWEFGLLE